MPTSSQNTKPGSPKRQNAKASAATAKAAAPSSSDVLAVADDKSPAEQSKDKAKASLEEQLQSEKDRRVEERFGWMVVCVILINVLWFRNAPNAVIPIVVLLLEAVILFILAKRMGIEEVSQLFERLIHGISRTGQQ
jgi:hypothetical protein